MPPPPAKEKSSIALLGSTVESRERVITFRLVFQRWTASERDGKDTIIPLEFMNDLRGHVLEPEINLDFDETFCLKCNITIGRRFPLVEFSTRTTLKDDFDKEMKENNNNDEKVQNNNEVSTRTTLKNDLDKEMDKNNDNDDEVQNNVEGENVRIPMTYIPGIQERCNDDDEVQNNNEEERNLISIRYVKKWDNDSHIMNVQTGETISFEGHWMSGGNRTTRSYQSILPKIMPLQQNAAAAIQLLKDHWINPGQWLSEGRAILVWPSKKQKSETVYLCDGAQGALSEGYTLLLVIGDLISIKLPGGGNNGFNLFMAGMMWKEKSRKDNNNQNSPTTNNNDNSRKPLEEHPNELAFIIMETRKERKIQENMYIWDEHDVYKYYAGRWG